MVAIIEKAKANRLLQATIEYLEATQLAAINRHRLTGGIGHEDFLLPGLDLGLLAGGLFPETDDFGIHAQASVGTGSRDRSTRCRRSSRSTD